MTVKKILKVILCVFALIGFIFCAVFVGMRSGLLNVKGSASLRNSYFNIHKKPIISDTESLSFMIVCQINVLNKYAPLTSVHIYRTLVSGGNDALIEKMVDSASRRFDGNVSFLSEMHVCAFADRRASLPGSAYAWAESEEWALMKEVFTRDQDIIRKAATDAGVSPRLILSGVIGEQFRFFGNRRESFKQYFEPMKILASLSNTSYGIAGLKPDTVKAIEAHLKDIRSPFYLGTDMEHVADYLPDADVEALRMTRITDVKNPYYPYLYVGLYMRQIQTQWAKSGYDLSDRPDILATLYNLGFWRSVPKPNPEAGGAVIHINGIDYTFGDIGYEFYYSGELSDIFPLGV